MANKYENFRNDIQAALNDNCVKVSKAGDATSYNWSIDNAFDCAGEACKFDDTRKLPSEFKDIVRFEFNKLKTIILDAAGFAHTKSRSYYGWADGSVEARRSDTYVNNAIPLADQLRGAQILLDKVGKQIANPNSNKNPESTKRLLKRQRMFEKECNFLRAEIDAQAKEIAAVNSLAGVMESVKIEVKSE